MGKKKKRKSTEETRYTEYDPEFAEQQKKKKSAMQAQQDTEEGFTLPADDEYAQFYNQQGNKRPRAEDQYTEGPEAKRSYSLPEPVRQFIRFVWSMITFVSATKGFRQPETRKEAVKSGFISKVKSAFGSLFKALGFKKSKAEKAASNLDESLQRDLEGIEKQPDVTGAVTQLQQAADKAVEQVLVDVGHANDRRAGAEAEQIKESVEAGNISPPPLPPSRPANAPLNPEAEAKAQRGELLSEEEAEQVLGRKTAPPQAPPLPTQPPVRGKKYEEFFGKEPNRPVGPPPKEAIRPPDVPPPRPPETPAPPTLDPKFEKYAKMHKAGLPLGAVQQAMGKDGLTDKADLDAVSQYYTDMQEYKERLAKPKVSTENQTVGGLTEGADELEEKYQKMLKMGVPLQAVLNKQALDKQNQESGATSNEFSAANLRAAETKPQDSKPTPESGGEESLIAKIQAAAQRRAATSNKDIENRIKEQQSQPKGAKPEDKTKFSLEKQKEGMTQDEITRLEVREEAKAQQEILKEAFKSLRPQVAGEENDHEEEDKFNDDYDISKETGKTAISRAEKARQEKAEREAKKLEREGSSISLRSDTSASTDISDASSPDSGLTKKTMQFTTEESRKRTQENALEQEKPKETGNVFLLMSEKIKGLFGSSTDDININEYEDKYTKLMEDDTPLSAEHKKQLKSLENKFEEDGFDMKLKSGEKLSEKEQQLLSDIYAEVIEKKPAKKLGKD